MKWWNRIYVVIVKWITYINLQLDYLNHKAASTVTIGSFLRHIVLWNCIPHTRAYFNGHLSRWTGLAGCPLDFPSTFIPKLRILFGKAHTLHNLLNTVPSSLPRTVCLSCINLLVSTATQHLTQSESSLRSTCPNHLNLSFLITKLMVPVPIILWFLCFLSLLSV